MKLDVKDVMSKSVVVCVSTDSCKQAAELMRKHHIGALPVVNNLKDKHLVGIITDRDLALNVVAGGRSGAVPVFNVMTVSPITCLATDSLASCEEKMQVHRVRRIPVIDNNGRCVAIVAQADIALHDDPMHVQAILASISAPGVVATSSVAS